MNAIKSSTNSSLMEVENLKKYYPIKQGIIPKTKSYVKAVDGVSFEILNGETLGLVGESGCGKSTLGRCLVKLETLTEGELIYDNKKITNYSHKDMKHLLKEIQMIFQDPHTSLNPRKRVIDILSEPLKVHGIVEKSAISKRVDELLEMVEIPNYYKHYYPHQFSGGQRQRIGIARALSVNPKLIILDEPVSALDVSIQSQILNLLKDLQRELGLTYLFIGHGLGAVKYISDRICVMYLGKIVEVASTEQIFNNPKHPYTVSLLNAYPIPNPELRTEKKIIIEGDLPSPVNPPTGCRFHTRCPIAEERCRVEEPLLNTDDEGHKVACFAVK